MGLPSSRGRRPPPTTRPVLSFRLLAALAGRFLRGDQRLDICNAWFDSSGLDGMFVRPELRRFPAQAALVDGLRDWDRIGEATKFWLLSVNEGDAEPLFVGMLDLQARWYWASAPEVPMDLYEDYHESGRDLALLVVPLEHRLRALATGSGKS